MSTLKDIVRECWTHRPMELAAALSYYTLLSLAPLVLMTVALATLLFERGAVEATIVTEIRALIGDSGAEVVHTILRNAHDQETGVLSVAIGAVVLLVGATTVFVQLRDALSSCFPTPRPHGATCGSARSRRRCSSRWASISSACTSGARASARPTARPARWSW